MIPTTPVVDPAKAQIISTFSKDLSQWVKQEIRGAYDPEKIWQYAKLRRMSLYVKGNQYLTYSNSLTGGGVDFRPIGQNQLSPAINLSDQMFDFVLNFLKGDVRAFDAVIGSRSPNVQAQARDLGNDAQVRLKVIADRLAAYLRAHWSADKVHRQLVWGLATKGTMFSYVRYVANGQKYGQTTEPEWGIQDAEQPMQFACMACGAQGPADPSMAACPQCGKPLGPEDLVQPPPMPMLAQVGVQTYNNGAVELDLCDSTTVTMPFWIKELRETPWLIYEFEQDKGKLIAAYPQLRDVPGLGTSAGVSNMSTTEMGRFTRDLISSPMGWVNAERRKNRWLFTNIWLPSTSYETLPNDKSGQKRDQLASFAPDGARLTFVEGELVDMAAEDLNRCWTAVQPEPADSIYSDPYFEDYIQASDNVNDALNAITEAMSRSNSLVIFSPDVFDGDRLTQSAVQPGEFLPAKIGAPSDLTKAFFRVPAAEINSAMFNFVDWMIQHYREVSGITDAIFGGGGPEPTARAAEMKRNQALMKLNTVWNNIRTFWEQTYEKGAWWAATCTNGALRSANGNAGGVDFQQMDGVSKLAEGGWFYHAEESMPMTVGQRRDFFMNAVQSANPMTAQLLGLQAPGNLARAQEAIGSPDWEVPGLAERNKMITILNQLSQTPLPPPQMDPMTGMQVPPMPAIAPEPLQFDPPFALQVIREWLNDPTHDDIDPMGIEHVLAYGRAWMQMMQPPAPPPGGPEGGGGPEAPGSADQPEPQQAGMEAPPPSAGLQPGEPPAPPAVAAPMQ